MDKKHILAIIGAVVMVSFFIIAASATITGQAAQQNIEQQPTVQSTGKLVEVSVKTSGGNFIFSPASVNVGDKVRLTADMSTVKGCYGTLVIPDIGVRKTFSTTSNTYEFTTTKAGTFPVTCGMGMAGGQFVVKDATGSAPVSTTPIQTPGGSCGASGGGCGCGG
ncbi:MAG: hypothetical protein V1870_02310 [Candidatus Aenigmatarchaeota archaeon]